MFMPDADAEYFIQKGDGQAEDWFLTSDSERRNENSGYVHVSPSGDSDEGLWGIEKTQYMKNNCYKIKSLYGKKNFPLVISRISI